MTKAKKPTSGKAAANNKAAGSLKPGEDRIVRAVGKLAAGRLVEPKRDFVQIFSGNGKTPEGFKKTMGILKNKGYIMYPTKDTVALTELGIEYVGKVDPDSMSLQEFHDNIREILHNGKQAVQIFDLLVDGNVHTKDELIEALNLDRSKLSGFEKNLSKMKSLGYLEKTKDTAQLTDLCFPCGRN